MDTTATGLMQSRLRGRKLLRDAGLKYSEQRLTVLHELATAKRPLTHREVVDRLAAFGWEASTIFRNLNDLCEAGLAARLDAGDCLWRFEFRQGPDDIGGHPHFYCVECGNVACLDQTSVAAAVDGLPLPSDRPVIREVLLKGLCAGCQVDESPASALAGASA